MEVIHFGSPNRRPPLLFIHGAFCGAWVWRRLFLPAFAQAGWWGAAISLRGHGTSEGVEKINSYGVDDYLEDIAEGTKLFDQPPILIGHSLGGYLAQKFALDHLVKGLVLLSAPSLLGLQGSMRHIALRKPMLALHLGALIAFGTTHADMRVIGKALFSDKEEAEKMAAMLPLLQRESSRALQEASWPDFRKPKTQVPTLALTGDNDAFVPEFDARYEAHFWNGKSKILRGVSHASMLDSRWTDVAREIMGWLMSSFPEE